MLLELEPRELLRIVESNVLLDNNIADAVQELHVLEEEEAHYAQWQFDSEAAQGQSEAEMQVCSSN